MIKDLLNKFAENEKRFLSNDIFSPYIKGGGNIVVRMNNIIYKLKTKKFKNDGFGIFRATDSHNARLIRQAEQHEVAEYLSLLPKVNFLLIYKVERWLGLPQNQNEFKNRFKADPNLFHILMADGVECFDAIETRFDGCNFWFDCVSGEFRADRKEYLQAKMKYETTDIEIKPTKEERVCLEYATKFYEEANKSNLEKRLEGELGKFEAKLDSFVERGNKVEVQWQDKKTRGTYTSVLKKDDLSVITAGICLSGGDKMFDIQSLVGVCREAENRGGAYHIGRGGMRENDYWDHYGGDE